MANTWDVENIPAAEALKIYDEERGSIGTVKENLEYIRADYQKKEEELAADQEKIAEYREKLAGQGEYVAGNIEEEIARAKEKAENKIRVISVDLDKKMKEALREKEEATVKNDEELAKNLKQLRGDDDLKTGPELSAGEKKALDFEVKRRKFTADTKAQMIKKKDQISAEKLSYKVDMENFQAERHQISEQYDPLISKYQDIMEEIKAKHQPNIDEKIRIYQEWETKLVDEREALSDELRREENLAENEIARFRSEYNTTKSDYDRQIKKAKAENRATTRLESSRLSRLNAINDKIQKTELRLERKRSGINQKLDAVETKYGKELDKADTQLKQAEAQMKAEQAAPKEQYDKYKNEEEIKLRQLQEREKNRTANSQKIVESLEKDIADLRANLNAHNAQIDKEIVEYVMSGDNNCLNEVLFEIRMLFSALQVNLNQWMENLNTIAGSAMEQKYQKVHEVQKHALNEMDYAGLTAELSKAKEDDNKLSPFVANNKAFSLMGGGFALVGLILMIVSSAVLKGNTAVSAIGLLVCGVGITVAAITIIQTNTRFAQICRYVSLAIDYAQFEGINRYANQQAEKNELESMKKLGSKLFVLHYGKAEAEKKHNEKAQEIENEYNNKMKLITVEFQSGKAGAEREREARIDEIREGEDAKRAHFNSAKQELQNSISKLDIEITSLGESLNELQREIAEKEEYVEEFEKQYEVLVGELNNSHWMTSMEYSHGILMDDLYLIPEQGEEDEYGHKISYKISHNKKALVMTYDISNIDESQGSKEEEVAKVIRNLMFDMMYAVYRMNSKEIYEQYIVDSVGGTNEFKNSTVRNAFNIAEISGSIEDMRGRLREFTQRRERLAEKGTTIDDVNRNNFEKQEKPEPYTILYIIYRPDERKSKLEDELRRLILECDKYGFLPIFICEQGTWDREIQEKESIYKDIKGLVKNDVVECIGATYHQRKADA